MPERQLLTKKPPVDGTHLLHYKSDGRFFAARRVRILIVTPRDEAESPMELWEPLTATERMVIELYASGFSRSAIGERLHLSKHTVSHLLASTKDKLHAKTLAEAATLFKKYLEP
jgi:DNA-binding NarL/FixJ family response regulator